MTMTERTIENTTLNTNERESNQAQDGRVAAVAARGARRWLILGLPLAGLLAVTAARADTTPAPTDGAAAGGAHEWHRGGHRGRGGHEGVGPMGGMRIHRLLGVAGASDAQKTQIKQIFEGMRPQMQTLRTDHEKVRQQLAQALTAPTVDASAVERLRLEQVRLADQRSKLMTQAMVKASQVLTPEQRQKIAGEIGKRPATK
jgi:protein CpxP